MKWFLVSIFAFCGGLVVGAEGDQTKAPLLKLFQTLVSANGNVTVEIRGFAGEEGYPLEAWVVATKTGKRQRVDLDCETYIKDTEVSADGGCLVFAYHISSGGYGEAFARDQDGRYRRIAKNGDAEDQIIAGKIKGLSKRDIPEIPNRNVRLDLHLGKSPTRLLFMIGDVLELSYSLEKRRITAWSRFLMEEDPGSEVAPRFSTMSLRELSGHRGIALIAKTPSEQGRESTILVEFPWQDLGISKEFIYTTKDYERTRVNSEKIEKFQLQKSFGEAGVIELKAARVPPEAGAWDWQLEFSGKGQAFEALVEKLRKLRVRQISPSDDSSAPIKLIMTEPS